MNDIDETLNYRFINVKSLVTNESINIGIIFTRSKDVTIELLDIDDCHNLYPIFDINHVNFCLNIIKAKYEKNKIRHIKIDISKTVSLSNIKIYCNTSEDDIIQSIFIKYITLFPFVLRKQK